MNNEKLDEIVLKVNNFFIEAGIDAAKWNESNNY